MSFSETDKLVQRFLDGELAGSEGAAFAARMLSDASLRERVEGAQQIQSCFAAEASSGRRDVQPASGFTAAVMSEIRRLPSRIELQQEDLAKSAVRLCSRLLLAAALLIGLGLGMQAGLFNPNGSGQIEAASPTEVDAEMQRLDGLARDAREREATERESRETPRRGR